MKKIYALLMLTLPFLGYAQNTHLVTFRVNAANITVGPNGIYAGGGVIGGADAVALSDPDGDGIWEGTDSLDGTAGGNFIFLNSPNNSNDWGTKESLAGLPCSDPANYDDRIMPTFTQDTTLEFCFGTCSPNTVCPAPPPMKHVTFIVDMTEYSGTNANYAGGVFVNGTFNGWCGTCNPMTDPDGDSIWTVTLPIDTGVIRWKFTVNGWADQENFTSGMSCTNTNTGGFTDRQMTVVDDEILKGVCYSECYSCDTNEVYATFQVNMENQTVDTTGLFVGGGSGMGGPTDNMLENIAGTEMWTATFVKPVGFHSDYIFLNGYNTGWGTKENLAGLPCAFGQWNDRTTDTMLTDWSIRTCYEVCATDGLCPAPAVQQNIHFVVDMNSPRAPSSFTQPYVSGNFNSWSGDAMPMTDADGDNVWEYTAMIDQNTALEYKFTLDNWAGQEEWGGSTGIAIDSTCTQDFGGFINRVYTVGTADDTLDFCFNYCESNCTSVGFGEDNLEFMVMPNPANDVLNVVGRTSEEMTVEVISLNGRTMMTESNTTGTVKLNVSMLPRALYLVHITQGDSHQWSRVSLN
tara:strand:- start:53 stop:1780 length:1728 start_codon:yes stop_codon:yes gene_type:complete